MTTFISFIGKGKPIDGNRFRYEDVNYIFEHRSVETSCFTNAVILSRQFVFDRVRIIGTVSSTWGQLLENPSAEEEDLFLQLDGADPDTLETLRPALTDALKKRWGISDVDLLVHDASLTGHEDAVLESYLDLMIQCDGSVVLDVTHSYRWMPLFLTSAMQLADAFSVPRSVRILYGELSQDKKSCPVRTLDSLWGARTLSMDIQLFFDKLEAEPLATHLGSNGWQSGANALRNLGSHLQGNFILPLVWDKDGGNCGQPIRQINNAIAELEASGIKPLWMRTAAKQIQAFCNSLTKHNTVSGRILQLAKLYADRQFFGQALICQEVALRLFILEINGKTPANIPDWEELVADTKRYMKENKRLYPMTGKIRDVLHNRNTVAHGALKSRDGGVPKSCNLPKQFREQQVFLEKLFQQNVK